LIRKKEIMIESVQFQQMVERSTQVTSAERAAGEPDQLDAARFREAVEENSGTERIQDIQAGGFQEVRPAETVGDAILGALEKVRANYNMEMDKVNTSLTEMETQKDFSPAEMIKLQWEVFHAMFQVEVTTKVVDKSDQGVNTLLRSQG